jgi:hypothetical protein
VDFMTSALIASWAAILLLGLVVSGLVRQVHQLSRGAPSAGRAPARLGLHPGTPAPQAAELFGTDLTDGGVLLFLSADCRTCQDVLAEVGRRVHAPGGPAFRALYSGPAPQTAAAGKAPVPLQGGREDLFAAYDALATPFAVTVATDGRVLRSVPLGSPAALTELLDDTFPHPAGSTR